MAKYDQDIRRYKELLFENPTLKLKDYCVDYGIVYDNIKTALYKRGEKVNDLRHCHASGKVSLSLNNSFIDRKIKAFLKKKGALLYISSKDANEFFMVMKTIMGEREIIDDILFWEMYHALWNKKHLFPTILKLLFRLFLFFIKNQGIENVFTGESLMNHFQDLSFRLFLEETKCEDPSHIFSFNYKDRNRTHTTFIYLDINNEQLLSLYLSFIEKNTTWSVLQEVKAVSSFIEPSISQTLLTVKQLILNEPSFWEQIYFFSNGEFDQDFKRLAIKHIVRFYIFYYDCSHHNRENMGLKTLTPSLLHCLSFSRLLEEGYTVLSFSDAQKAKTQLTKTIITLPQLSNITTSSTNRDFIITDWTIIHNPYYRKLVTNYSLTNKRMFVHFKNIFSSLAIILNYLEESKKNEFDTLTIEDSRVLRSFIINNSPSSANANSKLSIVKNLIQWAEEMKLLRVTHQIVYDYFSLLYTDVKSNPTAIPLEHATIIARELFDKRKNNPTYQLYFVLLVLLLETEFRPSQLCAIQIDRFRVVQNRDAYILQGISKVSKGDIESAAISKYSYDLLLQTLQATRCFREKCADNNKKRFLFLSPPGVRAKKQGYRIISTAYFSELVGNICRQHNLPHYTAQNFRDAHMTFAHNYDVTNKGDGFYLRLLSGHKTQLMTKEHYVDKTYNILSGIPSGFLIGTEEELKELESRIVSKVPNQLQGASHKTVDGIGVCSKNRCTFMTMINCVLCPHIWYIAEQDEKPLRLMIQEIEDFLSTDIPSHEREHKIQLKDALQKRLIAISKYLSKTE